VKFQCTQQYLASRPPGGNKQQKKKITLIVLILSNSDPITHYSLKYSFTQSKDALSRLGNKNKEENGC
jgi:hypothetical protein